MSTQHLRARVAKLASSQHGLVSRPQILDMGVSSATARSWVTSGRLIRVADGVYRVAGAPVDQHHDLQVAVLAAGVDAVVSHRSAAELWGFDGIVAPKPEVSIPMRQHSRAANNDEDVRYLVHRSRTLTTSDARSRQGFRSTTPERTISDLLAVASLDEVEVAFESARFQRLLTPDSALKTLERIGTRGRSQHAALRHLLVELGRVPAAESVLEVRTAQLLRGWPILQPERQVKLAHRGEQWRLDFAWPCSKVALECDGRRWHAAAASFEEDRDRWSMIAAAHGYRLIWATWQKVNKRPTRLLTELLTALDAAA